MIYLSAQPDQFYFLWQLQLQLYNFERMGIKNENIHILICYNLQKGLSNYFKDLITQNKLAKFYSYPDTRKSKIYDSSLRPHIIAKHFKANPWLENEAIFYHDSDIIFNRLPDFNKLLKNDIWYASDTRTYTSSYYIKDKIGEAGFKGMSVLMKVSTAIIEQHDGSMGGAQYLLKNVSLKFWQALEKNCEKMFKYLNDLNNELIFLGQKTDGIQAWCTDMWCLWWEAIRLGRKVAIHPELDFLWAHTQINDKISIPILHYTGNFKKEDVRYFRKNNYSRCSPFFENFTFLNNESASMLLVEEIREYNQNQLQNRINLMDVSFLISLQIDSEERLENLRIVTKYLHLLFKTNIFILEVDSEQKVDSSRLPDSINYYFVKDENKLFYRTKYNNQLINLSNTPIVALYDIDVVIPIEQILKSIDKIRNGFADAAYPFDGTFIGVDILMKTMFAKTLDINVLKSNNGKHNIVTERSFGGCIFLKKQKFLMAGGENENLTSWGPDDVERKKRIQILGFKIERIQGALYHLPHPRPANSSYNTMQQRKKLMDEYFGICRMNAANLNKYIETWHWKQK